MNHLMAQNAGISYPNMINYPMNMQVARPIDLSNPIQYSFQQSQAQRFIYPYILNQGIQNPNPINLPLQNMQNIVLLKRQTQTPQYIIHKRFNSSGDYTLKRSKDSENKKSGIAQYNISIEDEEQIAEKTFSNKN